MPTYEYQCPDGHLFEKLQKMSDKPGAKCPVCGKPAARKISGGAGLVFKGSGFYITDYGKDGKGPRKEPAEKAETAEKGGKTEKADTKSTSGEGSKPARGEKKVDGSQAKSASGKGKAASE